MSRLGILCVTEHDKPLLETIVEGLRRNIEKGIELETADSHREVKETIVKLAKEKTEVALVVCTQIVPGFSREYPEIKTVMMSAYLSEEVSHKIASLETVYNLIPVPWEEINLILTIKNGIREYTQRQTISELTEKLSQKCCSGVSLGG